MELQPSLGILFLVVVTVQQACSAAVLTAEATHPVKSNSDGIPDTKEPGLVTEIPLRDEDDEEDATVAGPGAVGILAGLNGIFANLVTGNLNKLVESTFNFVPPAYQPAVKGVYGSLKGQTPAKAVATTESSASASGDTDSGSKTQTEDQEAETIKTARAVNKL